MQTNELSLYQKQSYLQIYQSISLSMYIYVCMYIYYLILYLFYISAWKKQQEMIQFANKIILHKLIFGKKMH